MLIKSCFEEIWNRYVYLCIFSILTRNGHCCVLQCSLEYVKMERVQKPIDPNFHTPSSEPFMIYLNPLQST